MANERCSLEVRREKKIRKKCPIREEIWYKREKSNNKIKRCEVVKAEVILRCMVSPIVVGNLRRNNRFF
jgi:hypothetical protein